MAKKDTDLFDRLRQAGLRKKVARALSEIGEGAGKKAQLTARAAVSDLRALADEIERLLPAPTSPRSIARQTPGRNSRRAATPRATRSRTPRASATGTDSAPTTRAKAKPSTRRTPAAPTATRRRSRAAPPPAGTSDGEPSSG